jgi:thiamine-phosphate diphosphorylase
MSESGRSLARRLAVYLVADSEQTRRPLVDDVAAAIQGGVSAVQLRAKHLPDREAVQLATALRQITRDSGTLFLVNDRLDIALAVEADGVHLGVDDLPVSIARRLVPKDFVIGFSPETDEQAQQAPLNGADYLGVGPVFSTNSKSDAGVPIGFSTLSRRVSVCGIPVIGIGGISAQNAASVIETGAVGVAVVSAILGSDDPKSAARQLTDAVKYGLATA